ncbi:DUF429 domain-containing protein [Desulfuromonas carbonis]
MSRLYGVDGCKGGWIAAFRTSAKETISFRRVDCFSEFFDGTQSPEVLAIDIPIGLPDKGSRGCDLSARKLLGQGRGSSVFPAPIRPVFAAKSWGEACLIQREVENKGISKQAWAITPKIREVDEYLRNHPGIQSRVREVHPEVSFFMMAGHRPMAFPKRNREGRSERLALLENVFGEEVGIRLAMKTKNDLGCGADDLLDALAALWSAERIAGGTSRTLPEQAEFDRQGLRMEIIA